MNKKVGAEEERRSSRCKPQQATDNKGDADSGNKINNNNNNSNNNNVDVVYRLGADHEEMDGSLSGDGGSQESAFSSDGDDDCAQSSLDQSGAHDNRSSVSGRLSANQDSQSLSDDDDDDDRELTSADLVDESNLVPDLSEAMQLIEVVRVRFLESLKEGGEDLYDLQDLEELRRPLPDLGEKEQSLAVRLISRYTNFKILVCDLKQDQKQREKEIKSIVESLKELLKFRHKYQIPQTTADQFSQEFFILSGIFTHGHDKQNLPVLYIRARVHRKWSPTFDESFRRYVAWHVDRLTKSYSNAKVAKSVGNNGLEKDGSFAMCFDCLNVSYSCLDMDFLKFLVHLFVNYYPSYCRYVWLVDLPWIFRSVWKLVRTWLPEDSKVQLITAKQLTDYVDEDQIPNSMKINDLKASEKPKSGKHELPINFNSIRTIDGLAEELSLSSSEVKQFKVHVEKIRKEYEQLGAI